MGQRYIYIVATYDTKKAEAEFVKSIVEFNGLGVKTLDISTKEKRNHGADYSNQEIASFFNEAKVFCGDRGKATVAMSEALKAFVLAHQSEIAGVLGLGGSGGTAMLSPALQALPIGLPKIVLSTMASGNIAPYIGSSDINMMYSVTDIAGLNRISKPILTSAAHQIMGAVHFKAAIDTSESKPAIGMTMFGVTTPCVTKLHDMLADKNDGIIFHATGAGGKAMEKLIDSQLIDGVLDITTTEVCDYLFNGVLACDEDRFGAIARTSVPCVLSCGALDMVNFGRKSSIPEKYSDRLFYEHNSEVTLMRTTAEENKKLGEWIANKLNQCNGEVRFLIPLKGFSAIDIEDGPFWNAEADKAFIDAFEATFEQTDKRKLIKLDLHINDDAFAQAAYNEFCAIANEL